MSAAGRFQMATDILNTGLLCACPWVPIEPVSDVWGEITDCEIQHTGTCEGRPKVLELLSTPND